MGKTIGSMGIESMVKKRVIYLFFGCLFFASYFMIGAYPAYADFGFGTNSSYGFGQASFGGARSCALADCGSKACELKSQMVDGKLPNNCPSGTRYDVDPNCVMNNNAQAGSCIDTIPVAKLTRVAETNCYRANGAGSNPTPRNHYGTDYAATVGTPITAAADGTIVQQRWASGGGRSVIIEHTRQCQCTQGSSGSGQCSPKYHTVYYHLSAWAQGKGLGSSVKKGDVIGFVGGSNTVGGKNCDYKTTAAYKGDCYSYGPHLHFEIHHGPYANGANLKASMVDPLCDDIQTICGGCQQDVHDCLNKTNTNQWTELSEDAKQNKTVVDPPAGVSTGAASTSEGMSIADNTKCDYHNFMLPDDTCLFCPLFKTLFNTASSLALKTYNALKDSIVNVVIVAFALWIALFVLKHVSALEVKKPGKMLQELLVQTFRVLVVILILKVSYAQILRLTISPIFDTANNYIQAMMGNEKQCSSSASYVQGLKGYEKELDDKATGALPVSMGQNILCSMKAMQDGVWRIVAFGRECRCVGWHIKSWLLHLLPNLSYVLTGDFLIAAGLILLLAFPWCLVDCVLNMAIAAALLPAAIGAWAFKITSGYLKTIWNFFMNAIFQFVFLSIVLYIIITVVDGFLKEIDSYATDYEAIIDPIHGLAFWSVNGLKLVMVCLLGWVFLDNAKELADNFASAPGLGIGRSTGTFFAQAGERVALGSKGKDGKRHGGVLGVAKGGAEFGKMVGQHYIGTPLKRKVGQLRSDWVKNNGKAITNDDGETIGYEMNRSIFGSRNILGQKITRRVMINANGTMSYTKEREKVGTQLHNWARKELNNARVGLIQKHDDRYRELFNDPNQNVRTLEDGTKQLLNSKGKVIASMKTNEDGSVSISNRRGTTVYDAGGKLISAQKSYRNPLLLGEKQMLSINNANGQMNVTRTTTSLRAEALGAVSKAILPNGSKLQNKLQDIASSAAIKRERDLSSTVGKTQSVTKDHLISIREIKNAAGEVIQQDVAFRPDVTKYLIDRHGNLNTQMIEQIKQGSTLSDEQINLAIANEILKDRNIRLNNKFFKRDISFENGKLTIVQRNLDGTVSHLTTETRGNQMLVVMHTQDNKGNVTHIVDNGVMSRVVSKEAGSSAISSYGFNKHTRAFSSQSNLINKHGQFSNTVDENEAMWGFGEYDRQLHAKQVETGRNQGFDMNNLDAPDISQSMPQIATLNQNSADRVDDYRREAEQLTQQRDQLKAEIELHNLHILEHNRELYAIELEMVRSDITPQRREILLKRREELNNKALTQNARKAELEAQQTDMTRRINEHNDHVHHHENLK